MLVSIPRWKFHSFLPNWMDLHKVRVRENKVLFLSVFLVEALLFVGSTCISFVLKFYTQGRFWMGRGGSFPFVEWAGGAFAGRGKESHRPSFLSLLDLVSLDGIKRIWIILEVSVLVRYSATLPISGLVYPVWRSLLKILLRRPIFQEAFPAFSCSSLYSFIFPKDVCSWSSVYYLMLYSYSCLINKCLSAVC